MGEGLESGPFLGKSDELGPQITTLEGKIGPWLRTEKVSGGRGVIKWGYVSLEVRFKVTRSISCDFITSSP